jgi:hypothetical protein
MAERGGYRANAGRKSKADEQRLRDILSPYREETIQCVLDIMRNGEKEADRLSAAKLIMSYDWGTPKQHVDVTSDGDKINIPVSVWVEPKDDAE